MSKLKQFIPVCFSGILLSLVIWQVQPPQTLTQASPLQLIAFFIPLFLLISSTIFVIFQSIPLGIISGLIVILLLALKSLDLLNIITFIVILVAILFITKALKKDKKVSYQAKIPKISQLKRQ